MVDPLLELQSSLEVNKTDSETWPFVASSSSFPPAFSLPSLGYQSKPISFESIIGSFEPKVNLINICETNLQFNRKLNIPGYQCYTRNRSDKNQGGIASCVVQSEEDHCLKVSEGKKSNEYLITRHSQFSTAINVINI